MAWVTVGVAAYQIVSGFQQAEMVRENAKISREVAAMNADSAAIDARNAELDGMTQEARYQTVIDQTIGEQKVAFAAQGVDSNFGTASAIQAETKLTGELNKMDVRDRAHAEALGYKNQAGNIRLQSRMGGLQADTQASSIQNASILNAVGTGASGYTRTRGSSSPTKTDKGGESFGGFSKSSGYLGDYNF